MSNPITAKFSHVLIYFLFWTAISVVQFFFVKERFNQPDSFLLFEALIHNLIFGLLGLGIWYLVRYSSWKVKDAFKVIVNLSLGAILLVNVWVFGLENLFEFLFQELNQIEDYYKISRPWRMSFGFLFFVLIVLLYYVFLYYAELQSKKTREVGLEKSITEAKLNLLRNQINPHFLFNSLNSISSLTVDNSRAARQMIEKLSDFLRFSLAHKPEDYIDLSEELNLIVKYLEIEKVRFGDKLNFEVNISEDLKKIKVPNMILQPLIENAIKHGVQNSIEKTDIIKYVL